MSRESAMSCKATYCRSASIASIAVGSLWTFSQGARADTITLSETTFTTNAPVTAVATPLSVSGNLQQSVMGGDTPTASNQGSGGRLSPYAFNNGTGADGILARADAPYSVLGAGPNPPGSPNGSATYNINSPSAELLWGSPDPGNRVTLWSGPGRHRNDSWIVHRHELGRAKRDAF